MKIHFGMAFPSHVSFDRLIYDKTFRVGKGGVKIRVGRGNLTDIYFLLASRDISSLTGDQQGN